ncbi:MAG: sulfatase-like hydrolase/transferase [Thermoleophilaceae bacterium]|nr:sulfatase-like hydrolase/transferase [Thermoleophilaceae bacterium]
MARTALATITAAAALLVGLSCSSDQPRAGRAKPVAHTVQAPSKPYVVLLVMDEFPGDSLLDRRRRIDPVRYPNFAALAADGTWFRNAYSVYDSTTKALPLILDGVRPHPGSAADRRDHPHSIYDMFARHGYRIVDSEEATALCPPSLCRGGRTRRPAIIPNLLGGRPERFNRWVRSIEPGKPALWVKHLLLPHGPYQYLPSGARTRPGPGDLLHGMNTVPGFHDEFLTRHNEQRYLLQLGFTDRLLGRLVRRLKDQGIYDDTLIVATADHGIAFQVGVQTRRSVSQSNVEELTPVPLFVKRPGQRRGRISDAYARTLDVTPTIADVLGWKVGHPTDGHSAFGPITRRRHGVTLSTRDFSSVVRISGRRWEARRRAVVRRRLREFGSGDIGSLFTGIGPRRELIGRTAPAVGRASVRASLAQSDLFANVRRASGVVPTQVAGDLRGGGDGAKRDLAIAVNGRIEAVGRSFYLQDDPTEHFALMVPDSALREGRNRLELFEVVAGRLRRL